MNILAIETSCDETAAAVVRDGREILSNKIYTQIPLHEIYGGVVPEIASRAHVDKISQIVQLALSKSGISISDIDAISASCAPGLIGALLVGVNFAKSLAFAIRKPFIPVHHIRGHIAANYLTSAELSPPFCALVVSGGNSIIVDVMDYTEFTLLGTTRDDAAGEVFDKLSRFLSLGYPGGAQIDALAKNGDPERYTLPRSDIAGCPFDMSFSGLKTAAINLVSNTRARGEHIHLPDFCASLSKAVCDVLVARAMRAVKTLNRDKLVCAGGVLANTMLRERLRDACDEAGAALYIPDIALCGDNAAMIGAQAFYEHRAGNISGTDQNARATADITEAI